MTLGSEIRRQEAERAKDRRAIEEAERRKQETQAKRRRGPAANKQRPRHTEDK